MYRFNSRVRFSETDPDKSLSLISIIDYLQDCSTFHSEDLGVGMDALVEKRLTWMLAGWQIVVDRYPKLCENITIATWPYGFRGFFGDRNFAVYDEKGEIIVKANSVWFLVNLDTGKPIKVLPEIAEKYTLEPKIDMDYAPRKIKFEGEPVTCASVRVYKHQIDANSGGGPGHMNNGQYVLVARDVLPEEVSVKQVRVDYKKAALLDDVIVPKLYTGENTYTVALDDEDGSTFAVVEFKTEL